MYVPRQFLGLDSCSALTSWLRCMLGTKSLTGIYVQQTLEDLDACWAPNPWNACIFHTKSLICLYIPHQILGLLVYSTPNPWLRCILDTKSLVWMPLQHLSFNVNIICWMSSWMTESLSPPVHLPLLHTTMSIQAWRERRKNGSRLAPIAKQHGLLMISYYDVLGSNFRLGKFQGIIWIRSQNIVCLTPFFLFFFFFEVGCVGHVVVDIIHRFSFSGHSHSAYSGNLQMNDEEEEIRTKHLKKSVMKLDQLRK